MMPPISVIILLIVFCAIAARKIIQNTIPIWVITLLGAIATLLFQEITPKLAIESINPEVMIYLLGVFLICCAAESSGYLEYLTDRIFFHAHNGKQALVIITFVLGISSAFQMNDTIAIIGTPIILQLCKTNKKLINPLLLALAFSVTIVSTMSPIGNPQNLLIAVKSGMSSPFFHYFKALVIPTIINLLIAYYLIYFTFKSVLNKAIEKPKPSKINDTRLVWLVKISLVTFLFLIILKIITEIIQTSDHFNFSYIAFIAALPIFLSPQIGKLLKKLDWGTLIFFASTFVLVQSVWDSGFLQNNIEKLNIPITHIYTILILSIILSQFISNVPLVVLYLPLLIHNNVPESHFLALAVGSTIAGNLSILGAASNVIIIHNAEKRIKHTFDFFEFLKIGFPLTIINILIYIFFLNYF